MACTGAKLHSRGVTIFIIWNKPNVVVMEIPMLNACKLIGFPALTGNTFVLDQIILRCLVVYAAVILQNFYLMVYDRTNYLRYRKRFPEFPSSHKVTRGRNSKFISGEIRSKALPAALHFSNFGQNIYDITFLN
jgi:hypothetical protein